MRDIRLWEILRDVLDDPNDGRTIHQFVFPRQKFRVTTNLIILAKQYIQDGKKVIFVTRRGVEASRLRKDHPGLRAVPEADLGKSLEGNSFDYVIADSYITYDTMDAVAEALDSKTVKKFLKVETK
ncbi:hypothetical protein Ab1vBOLIVR5_gp255 [Agrobacterium phage OLIVR5]|uniref:Uncharacterized protein n=2 Tax=Caudoviricetes TaxID=2731619 RepID=A0A858MTR8_9CAUD|nr:hypothetical protein KNU99_gp146 [Agrobacterium phage OLIVR5]QIW87903.1 hypothetical protein Ab1vBOLIVR5_gp255 [Agrobacterium phage OLIVR5]QIW88168.1 hypothetical protein Ab1vBOLIVR6_gp261 [Agrobacterium phage OLIVR6]